jgi:hypothetical protein
LFADTEEQKKCFMENAQKCCQKLWKQIRFIEEHRLLPRYNYQIISRN